MTARILDGKRIAREVRADITTKVAAFSGQTGVIPGLAAVLVGDNQASKVYVRNKEKACQEAGIFAQTFSLNASTTQSELDSLLTALNADPRFHGILLQLPLPAHLNERLAVDSINPNKDIDGLHTINMGRLMAGETGFVPCTPSGIQELLLRTGHDPSGQHVVVVGRSQIVGMPLAVLLAQKKAGANATVTVCHSKTRNLQSITHTADILVAAIGQPESIRANMVREGAVVIDVGINRVVDPSQERGYRLVGDVAFNEVAEKASAITPVPGGVGVMTVAMLVSNTLQAAEHANQGNKSSN